MANWYNMGIIAGIVATFDVETITLPGVTVYSVGVDIISIARVRNAVDRWGDRFQSRVYTPAEVTFCHGRVPELAARFAA